MSVQTEIGDLNGDGGAPTLPQISQGADLDRLISRPSPGEGMCQGCFWAWPPGLEEGEELEMSASES
jgi:hypothetical protein